ncbi:MAG: YdeI/OmpD-associated family protein [Longimicrobiaceae bacterium]
MPDASPTFFATPAELRAWLEEHHATETELLVGFYKKGSGKPSITWPESVDEALCYGWIDGVRRSLGDDAYTIRFTPRKKRSFWSNVNIRRAGELIEAGRMRPAGLAAFEARTGERSGVYSFEQKDREKVVFGEAQARQFQANPKAWEFFQAQAPWYRRTATWWVISAKKEETRAKRLATLIAESAAGKTIRQLTRKPKGE